jgi:hypothetical protein
VSDDRPVTVVLCSLSAPIVLLMVLTGQGQARRGGGVGVVLLAAVLFPLAWVAWYAADPRPGRRDSQRSGAASDSLTAQR